MTIFVAVFIGLCVGLAVGNMEEHEAWPLGIFTVLMGAVAGKLLLGTIGGALLYALVSNLVYNLVRLAAPAPKSQLRLWTGNPSPLHNPSQGETCQFCAGEVPGDACIYCKTRKGEKIPPVEATGNTIQLAEIADCVLSRCSQPGVHYVFGKEQWCLCRTHFVEVKGKIERAVELDPSKARFDHAKDLMQQLAPFLFSENRW